MQKAGRLDASGRLFLADILHTALPPFCPLCNFINKEVNQIYWMTSINTGAPGQDRTVNTRFRRPMLYPLSYGRLCKGLHASGQRFRCRETPPASREALRLSPLAQHTHSSHFGLAALLKIAFLCTRLKGRPFKGLPRWALAAVRGPGAARRSGRHWWQRPCGSGRRSTRR